MMKVGNLFYWYGENKERTDGVNGIWHWGARCYSSRDLYNWDDMGIIIAPQPDDPSSPLYPYKGMDRPHNSIPAVSAFAKIRQPDRPQLTPAEVAAFVAVDRNKLNTSLARYVWLPIRFEAD
jgi:hypothetical protein